ncbi:MAG: PLP-dependent aspartate aminotransferase family protein [Thermomicrobiales bacterium]
MSDQPLDLGVLHPATRAVHAGERLDTGSARPTANPLHLSTSYSYETTDELDDAFDNSATSYVYSRHGSPNTRAFEAAIAALEETDAAIAYPSGMAAINAALTYAAEPGSHILASRDIYGATVGTLRTHFQRYGVTHTFVDILDLDAVARAAHETRPAAIILESISNPLIRVADIASLAGIAREVNALLIVDNTFASPVLMRPATLGADMVVHSTTKFLAGHGDTTGGVIATNAEIAPIIREQARISGAMAGPFDSWLTLRGIKTLAVRMRQHSENAAAVVSWLTNDPRVDRIYYPGLNATIPESQFTNAWRGAMLSFEINGAGKADVSRFLDSLELIQSATTLGDVYSLALYPAMSSHRGLSPEERAAIGIADNLVRISVGIEAVEDIIADLDRALTAATAH